VGLRPLAFWDSGFESHRWYGCLLWVLCVAGRGLCDGLITRPEESYRLWRVVMCNQETSKTRRLKPTTGLWKMQPQWVVTPGKQTTIYGLKSKSCAAFSRHWSVMVIVGSCNNRGFLEHRNLQTLHYMPSNGRQKLLRCLFQKNILTPIATLNNRSYRLNVLYKVVQIWPGLICV